MLPGYAHTPCKDCITKLSLLTLQQRPLKGNFIEVSKIIFIINRSIWRCQFPKFVPVSQSGRDPHTIFKQMFLDDIGKYSFSNQWNQLSEDIITCTSVGLNSFKNRLDRFRNKRGFI